MERSMNPSSRRSRRWITKALLELMMDKPYQKISITEIAEEADVVRRTFYRNFESKEDVIKSLSAGSIGISTSKQEIWNY